MKATSVKPVRCAIYTRVSTDQGLDQEFNSLDAQYDASSAYIRSQAHAGWTLIKAQPKFSEVFMAYLLTRNSRIEEDLIDQLFNSSERRLARLLLLLANFGKEGSPQPISPNMSQETLAEMIGTTRSRVSYFMNKFRKLGLIDYNGHIEVHNSLLSAVMHEKPQLHEDE
jgi:CRP-like cAMP-binding protein